MKGIFESRAAEEAKKEEAAQRAAQQAQEAAAKETSATEAAGPAPAPCAACLMKMLKPTIRPKVKHTCSRALKGVIPRYTRSSGSSCNAVELGSFKKPNGCWLFKCRSESKWTAKLPQGVLLDGCNKVKRKFDHRNVSSEKQAYNAVVAFLQDAIKRGLVEAAP